MKTAFRICFIFAFSGFLMAMALWAVLNDRADRRLSVHPAFRAAMMGDGPSASLARFAARPDGGAVGEDPDNAATWMARLPSHWETEALLRDGLLEASEREKLGWPLLPGQEPAQSPDTAERFMRQVINNPTLLTGEQRQRFCGFFDAHSELVDTLAKMGDWQRFDLTALEPTYGGEHYVRYAAFTLIQRALLAASAVLGLEGESGRAAELWMIAVRAKDYFATSDNAGYHHFERMQNLLAACAASVWIFGDSDLDREKAHGALDLMRTDPIVAQLRLAVGLEKDRAIENAAHFLRGEGEDFHAIDSVWRLALSRMAITVISPLLKEDLGLMVDQYDAFQQMLEAPPWEWDLDALRAESKVNKEFWRMFSPSIFPRHPLALQTRNAMTTMDATRLAMAALLWRRDYDGRLPESLDALVPEYLDALPRDSRTGGPFTLFDLDGRLVVHSDRAEVADFKEQSLNRPNRPEDAIGWWVERSPASSAAEVLAPPTDQ